MFSSQAPTAVLRINRSCHPSTRPAALKALTKSPGPKRSGWARTTLAESSSISRTWRTFSSCRKGSMARVNSSMLGGSPLKKILYSPALQRRLRGGPSTGPARRISNPLGMDLCQASSIASPQLPTQISAGSARAGTPTGRAGPRLIFGCGENPSVWRIYIPALLADRAMRGGIST